jgi:hypothetical protein
MIQTKTRPDINSPTHLSGHLTLSAFLIASITSLSYSTVALSAVALHKDVSVFAAYTLVAPKEEVPSGLLARAILPMGVKCPLLQEGTLINNVLSWHSAQMTQRLAPANTDSAFKSVMVCEHSISKGTQQAKIGEQRIPASLPNQITKVAVFGDTGCRMRKGGAYQPCETPQGWPLSRIAEGIANHEPQLVIFTGDFYYREYACDPTVPTSISCASSPGPLIPKFDATANKLVQYAFKDSDYGWIADVFLPMRAVFSAAPMVIVRGNHELCSRGGNGYFLFFDPRKNTSGTCAPNAAGKVTDALTKTWKTDINIRPGRVLRLAVVDSAIGQDYDPYDFKDKTIDYAARYKPGFVDANTLTASAPGLESWLLVHKPVFGLSKEPGWNTAFSPALPGEMNWSSVPLEVASYGLLSHYNLIVSSHVHAIESIQVPGVPPQLVIGNGGTELDAPLPYNLPSTAPLALVTYPGLPATPYQQATSKWADVRFGYSMIYPGRAINHWKWEHYSPDFGTGKLPGAEVLYAKCDQALKQLTCVSQAQ